MVDVIVLRGDGDVQGDDIVDPLLSTLTAALARGEQALNDSTTGKIDKTIEIPYTSDIEPGVYVQVIDDFLLEQYVGKVENIDINTVGGNSPASYMQLKLLVPEDFFTP